MYIYKPPPNFSAFGFICNIRLVNPCNFKNLINSCPINSTKSYFQTTVLKVACQGFPEIEHAIPAIKQPSYLSIINTTDLNVKLQIQKL
jgi:hypothetical protein